MAFIWCVLSVCAVAHPDNLLTNPSFEELKGDMPKAWSLFVMPQNGAEGRLVAGTASDGEHSVLLHTAVPYEDEPINNWSQNIIADLGGKALQVRGMIKTEDVTEAAILVQCFRKKPYSVLYAESTSTDSAIFGTRDWTPVEMRVNVPGGTDFVTCRCILKGIGTAWFDDIEVDVEPEGAEVNDAKKESETTQSEKPPVKPPAAAPPKDASEKATIEGLIDSQSALVEANAALRETNRVLQEEIVALRERILVLQDAAESLGSSPGGKEPEAALVKQAPGAETRLRPVPPIVPHGYDLAKGGY